jgi:hypothetical protein
MCLTWVTAVELGDRFWSLQLLLGIISSFVQLLQLPLPGEKECRLEKMATRRSQGSDSAPAPKPHMQRATQRPNDWSPSAQQEDACSQIPSTELSGGSPPPHPPPQRAISWRRTQGLRSKNDIYKDDPVECFKERLTSGPGLALSETGQAEEQEYISMLSPVTPSFVAGLNFTQKHEENPISSFLSNQPRLRPDFPSQVLVDSRHQTRLSCLPALSHPQGLEVPWSPLYS